MNRRECRGQISQGSLQFSKNVSAGIKTIVEQSKKVWRISFFTALQSILHFIQSLTGRVEILGREKCSFFEVIQKTLLEVSARRSRDAVLRKQTLMVDVMEYLR